MILSEDIFRLSVILVLTPLLLSCATRSPSYISEEARNLPTTKVANIVFDIRIKDMTVNDKAIDSSSRVVLTPGEYSLSFKVYNDSESNENIKAVVSKMKKEGFRHEGRGKFTNCPDENTFSSGNITIRCTTWRLPSYRDLLWQEIHRDIKVSANKTYKISRFVDYSRLMNAIIMEDVSKVHELLNSNEDVNYRNKEGGTALIFATWKGHLEIAQALLAKGAYTDIVDKKGLAAIHYASHRGHVEIVQELIANGSDIDLQSGVRGTALMYAAFTGHEQTVKYLLTNGADPNMVDGKGRTALSLASEKGYIDIVQELLTRNADASIRDLNGKTALQYAKSQGVKKLLKASKLTDKDEATHVVVDAKKMESGRITINREILLKSKLWIKERDAAAMRTLLTYCFDESVTQQQVKELMGEPDQVLNNQGLVWIFSAKPEKDGEVQSAIFGFDENKRVVRGILKSSTGAMHQKIRDPAESVE